jgi:hypothetical protein
MATFGDRVIVSGFGDSSANGSYYYTGEYNGQAMFQKGNYYIFYSSQYDKWSMAEAYYLVLKKKIQGSIPIYKPLYRLSGSNVFGSTWTSLLDSTSGENTCGITVFDEESSSSSTSMSSSSSIDSSSSSSHSSSSSSSHSSSSSSSHSSSSSSSSSTSMSSSSSSSSTSNSSSSSSSSHSSSSSSSSSTSMSSSSSSSSTSQSSSSSSSSTSMSSSSSSSESSGFNPRAQYWVSAKTTLSQDCTGNYSYGGIYLEDIYYVRDDGMFYIWLTDGSKWCISRVLGDTFNGWLRTNNIIEGDYTDHGPGVSGIPTVHAVATSSSSSSSSTSLSSSSSSSSSS